MTVTPQSMSTPSAAAGVQPTGGDRSGVERAPVEPSIGELVKEASTQLSVVLHGEIELAKIELKSTFKHAGTGVVFFLAAAVFLLFSLTFGFIALAEGLHALYFSRWLSYLIIFGFIVTLAGFSALLGIKKVKKVKAPHRTIATTKQTVAALRHPGSSGTTKP